MPGRRQTSPLAATRTQRPLDRTRKSQMPFARGLAPLGWRRRQRSSRMWFQSFLHEPTLHLTAGLYGRRRICSLTLTMKLASQGPARELAVFKDFRERSPLLSSFYSDWATTNIRDDDLLDWLRRLFHMND